MAFRLIEAAEQRVAVGQRSRPVALSRAGAQFDKGG